MKKAATKKTKIALLSVLVMIAAIISIFAVAVSASATAVEEGRNFKGDNAVTSLNERLEVSRPLEEIPLTYEAVIKITGLTDGTCKGTLFGNYGGNGVNCFMNFEIFRNSTYKDPSPAVCYPSNSDATKMDSVVFSKGTPITDANGKTNKLSDHLNEWVHVVVTATPVEGSDYTYDFDCYINGEKAYNTMRKTNVYFTKENLAKAQESNKFALGSNAVSSNPVEFPGTIKTVALYNRALTAKEVKDSYEKGVSSVSRSSTTVTSTGLMAHYDMSVVEDAKYEEDLSGNRYDLRTRDYGYILNSEGRTFKGERLVLTEKLTEVPLTLETVIKVSDPGTMFGNFKDRAVPTLNFEIFNSAPAFCFPKDSNGTFSSVIFANYLINGVNPMPLGEFAHVVLTITPTGNTNEYNFDCYINGVKGYQTVTAVAYFDMELIQSVNLLSVGSNGKDVNFPGNMRTLNLYNRPLTEAEIKAAYEKQSTFGGLIAGYDMSDASHIRNPQYEADISGNGYHAQKASTVGLTFTQPTKADSDHLYVYNLIEDMPKTIEATVYTTQTRGCVIFGNYPGVSKLYMDFEIFNYGNPAIVVRTETTTYSIKFTNYVLC